MAETKTQRVRIGGRWLIETLEKNDRGQWVSLGKRYDPNQEDKQQYDVNGNPIRTGSYYEGFYNNLEDFNQRKAISRPIANPIQVTREDPTYIGGKLAQGAPRVGTMVDQEFVPSVTGIPMNLRKHINKLNRRVPDPSQPAYKDYKEALDKINAAQSRTSTTLPSGAVANTAWAQNAGWDKLVSIAEQTIVRQGLQVNGLLETAYQEAVRRIASSSSPNKTIELQTLASDHQVVKASLKNVLRAGGTRTNLARNLARSLGSTQTNISSLASTMIQEFVTQNVNFPLPKSSVRNRVGGNMPGPGKPTIGPVPGSVAGPMGPQTAPGHYIPNDFNQSFGTPGYQNSSRNKITTRDPLAEVGRIMRGTNPLQQLQDARKAWKTILSGTSAFGQPSPADRDIGNKILDALDQLEQSWKGKGNSGVAAALPRKQTTLSQDPIEMTHKEHAWIIDAERASAGHSTWDVGSRSQDPKVRDSFARTGVGTSGNLQGEDPQVRGRRQEAIDRWLNATSSVNINGSSQRISNRAFFAAQEKGTNYTTQTYSDQRKQAIANFLRTDQRGKEIAQNFSSIEEAIPHVLNVIDYRAKMSPFAQPAEGRAIKAQGGKPGGLEQQLDVIGPRDEPFILGNGTTLTIGKAFEARSVRSGSYKTNLNRELGKLGLDESATVAQAVQTMMHVTRTQFGGQGGPADDNGENAVLMKHFPTLVRGLEKIYRQGGTGQGVLSSEDVQGAFGNSSYEGGAGDDDFDSSEIGSSSFFGQTGLNKHESEYSAKSRWSWDIIKNRRRTIVADRLKQAQVTDLFRVMSAITSGGSEQGFSNAAAGVSETYAQKAVKAERYLATGLTTGGRGFAQFLGTTASGWDMQGSRRGISGETIFNTTNRDQVGREIVNRALYGQEPRMIQLNILEDEARRNNMESAHLNREHATNLARLGSPPIYKGPGMIQGATIRDNLITQGGSDEFQKHVMSQGGPWENWDPDYSARIANRNVPGEHDPNKIWHGRDMPSTTYGSLHPAARGAVDAYSMYNSLVSQTKEIFGLGETGGSMTYMQAAEQARNAGDEKTAEMFIELGKRAKGIAIEPEGLPMGRGLSEKSGAPITKFLPFNPLFSVFHDAIESGSWNMGAVSSGERGVIWKNSRRGRYPSSATTMYTQNLKNSEAYNYSRTLLRHEFGQTEALGRADRTELFGRHDITPEQFKEMFASRVGFRIDEYGELTDSAKKRFVGKGANGEFSSQQLVELLTHGFGHELNDWAANAGIKQGNNAKYIARNLVASGAIHQAFGGRVGPRDFANVYTRGAEPSLFDESDDTRHHKGDRLVTRHDFLMNDMFVFGGSQGSSRSLIPNWAAQEFGNRDDLSYDEKRRKEHLEAYQAEVIKQRAGHGLWTPDMDEGLRDPNSPWFRAFNYRSKSEEIQNSLRNIGDTAMALRNWASDMQQTDIRQMSDQFESTPGLLHEASHYDQDKFDILIANRQHRASEFVHQPLEEASPILHQMLLGVKQGNTTDVHANSPNGPPGAYKASAVLNAAYDAIASQVTVTRDKKEVGMHEIEESLNQFRNRTSKEIKESIESGGKTQPSGITMSRGMIIGETTAQANLAHGGKRGIGIYGIETVEQAQEFERIMSRLNDTYSNSQGPLGFDAQDLIDLSELMGWNYDRNTFVAHVSDDGKERGYIPQHMNMPRRFLGEKQRNGKIFIRDRLMEEKNTGNFYGIGYSTHRHIGDTINPLQRRSEKDILHIPKAMRESGQYSQSAVRAFTDEELAKQYSDWFDPDNPKSAYTGLISAQHISDKGRKTNLAEVRTRSEGFAELARHAPKPSRWVPGTLGDLGTPNLAARIKQRREGRGNYWSEEGQSDFTDNRFNAEDVRSRMLAELQGLGITDVNVGFKDFISGLGGANARGMYYKATGQQQARIVLSYPDQNITEDEAFDFRRDTLHHEALHHMAATGMITPAQIASLSSATSRIAPQPAGPTVIPGSNYSEQIQNLYGNTYTGENAKKQMDEERAAMLYGLYVKNSGKSTNTFSDMPEDAMSLLSNIYGGKLGNHQKASEDLLAKMLEAPAQETGRGSGRSLPPQSPPFTGNMSDRFEFHQDPAQTISPMDMMMQQLIQFAHRDSAPLFNTKDNAYAMSDPSQFAHIDDDFMQLNGHKWTESQKQFIGAPITPGGAPIVLTGNPGSGKTDVEVARVLHRLQQPGMTPENAPILTSFANVTLEETQSRLDALVKAGKLSVADAKRYVDSGGVTTIHKLGMRLLSDKHLGWNNVFGKTAFEMKGENGPLYGHGGDDIHMTRNGELMTPEEVAAIHGDKMEMVDGHWQIKKGINFDRFEQASGSHQIEMFRNALHEVWHSDLQASGYDVENTDIWRHARGSLPLMHPNMDVRQGSRNGIFDRNRPMAALQAEMEATGENTLWKNVQILAESGIHHSILSDFFDPVSKNTKMTGDIAGFAKEFTHNKGEMWLASKVLGMMDTRAQRGSLADFKKTDHDGEDVPQNGLIRYYMPWDLVNKPLQYMQNNMVRGANGEETLHPRIKNALNNLYGREMLVSEGQDANLGQIGLLGMLAGGVHKLALSGDPKQDLYPWRGGTRRWLKMAAEAAKKSGSFVHLSESFRFTGGSANFMDQARRNLVSYDETGTKFQVMPESPLVAAGPLASNMNSTIAVNVHPYGPKGEMGGKDWEYEVMAQQVRHQMGLGIDKTHLDEHQAAAIDEAVLNTGASAGGAIAHDFIVVARSNDDVAQITKKYLARGINARANFASDKISQWEEMDKSFDAFDTETLQDILANKSTDSLQWFANNQEGAKILNLYRGGDSGVGKYRSGDNQEASTEALIKDVLKAREYLSLPRASEAKATNESPEDKDFVLVGTTHGVKGKQRRFAQVPGAIERNFKLGTARTAVEARENFVNLYTALTRGSQAFLYGSNTSEGPRRGKNLESGLLRQARQFASGWGAEAGRQAMQEIVVGPTPEEKRRLEPDWAVQRNLQPGRTLAAPKQNRQLFSEFLAQNGVFRTLSDGGRVNDGTVIAGEGGQDEMLVTKHGAKMMKGTHILDVDKIGAVEILNQKQIKEAKAKGNKIINELMNGMGEATAYRGFSYRRRSPKVVGSGDMDMPESGMGTITPFSDTSYGHETAVEMTDYLRQQGKFNAELIGDAGKGWMVKTKAAGPNEMQLIRTAIAAYAAQPNKSIAGQTNAQVIQDEKGVDFEHRAFQGIEKGNLQHIAGDEQHFGYGSNSRQLEQIMKPIEGFVEKVKIFNNAVGEATKPLDALAKVFGRDSQGLIKRAVTDMHRTEGTIDDMRTGQPLAPHGKLLKELGIKGKQVEDTFDIHGEGMTFDPIRQKYRYYEPGESRSGGTRQLTGNDLTRWQAQQGYTPPGESFSRRLYNSAQQAYFETQFVGQFKSGVESATNNFDQNVQDSSAKHMATNAALFQANALPAAPVGSAEYMPQLQGGQGMLHDVYKSNRDNYEAMGLSEADFMNQASTFIGMGGHGFSSQTMAGAQAASEAAKEAGKDQAKAFTDFLENSPEGKSLPGFMQAGMNIGFAGQQMGVDATTMMKATTAFGNAGGVKTQDAGYMSSIAGVLTQGSRTSIDNPNDYISAGKYVLGNVSSLMTGTNMQGQQYASASDIGLSDTNPDGTKKTPQQMITEQEGVAKAAEIAAVFSAASDKGIGTAQAGRGLEAMTQSQYNMNPSQSWLYAQQTGVVDKNNQLTGIYTSNPQVYQESLRQSNASYGLTQAMDQQRSTKLSFEGLKIEAKSIDLQAQSVAIESQKFAEMAPIQKQTMIDQNVVQNLGYAQNLRQAQFAVSLQPEESQVFGMQQQQQANELARTQRSVAASRAYEDALYGAPGQDRSYNAFAKSSQNALAQSQGGQNVGQYVQAVTQGVGLEAAQTYEGIGYSRTMLTLGQSNLNSGAAYAAQMAHLDKTQAFAEEQFKLSSTQRGSERQIQDESLKEQADLLPVVQDLEKKRFDEQQRQTREALDLTLAQGKTLADSNAEFGVNLKYYDRETQIQKDQYDIQSENLALQEKVNKENRRQNLELQAHLTDVIPKMDLYNKALIDQINGYGANKGRTSDDLPGNDALTGYQDNSSYMTTILSGHKGDDAGAAARRRAQMTGGDASLANMYQVLQEQYGTDANGQRAIDKAVTDYVTGAATRTASAAGAQTSDLDANAAIAARANKTNTSANAGDNVPDWLKHWNKRTRAGWNQASTDVTNFLGVPVLEPVAKQVPTVATWWGLSKGLGWLKSMRAAKPAADIASKGLTTAAESGAMTAAEAEAAGITLAPGAGAATAAEGMGILAPGAMSPLIPAAAMAIGGYAAGRGLDWATGKAFGVNTHHAGADIGTGAGIGAAVGTFVLPGVGTAAGAGIGAAAGAGYWAITHPDEAKKAAQAAYDAASDMFSSIKNLPWGDIKKYAKDALLVVGGPFTAIYEVWTHWDDIKAAMEGALGSVTGLFTNVMGFLGDHADDVLNAAQTLLGYALYPYTEPIKFFTDHADDVLNAGVNLFNMIVGLPGQIMAGVGDLAALGGNIAKGMANGMIDMVNGFLGVISGLKIGVPGGGHFGIPESISMPDIPNIPHLASGGYAMGGLTIVGENGPELLQLGKGDTVTNAARSMQVLRGFAPSIDLQTGHARSLVDNGKYDPRFTLSPSTATNMTHHSNKHVEVTINIAAGAQIDEHLLNRMKAEVAAEIRKVIED